MAVKHLKTLGITSDNSACATDGLTPYPRTVDDLVLVTGTTVVNGTIEPILEMAGGRRLGLEWDLLLFLLVLFVQGVLSDNSARYKRLSIQNPISLNMEAISIEPTGEMRMKIERLSKIQYMDTPLLIRKLIDIGIDHELKDYAIGLFRDKKVSMGKAAEISGISKRAMLELLKERDIPLNISTRDIQKDFNAATE